MISKFIEIGPGQNSLPTIKETDSDNLFIASNKKLFQFSVSQGEVIKDYADIMTGKIGSMVLTSDKNYLFF
jgi:WD40 repeat protein